MPVETCSTDETWSYGLDLAGYSTGKSALARAKGGANDSIDVDVVLGHPFAKKVLGATSLQHDDLKQELDAFVWILRQGRLFIDVPVDLQGLPNPANADYVWQLTQRAVDRMFGGLAPLADRLGAPVARMARLLARCQSARLGQNVFETYPAQSLKNILADGDGYKRQSCKWHGNGWSGGKLATLAQGLGLKGPKEVNFALNDDEFDAIVCALCGVVKDDHRLEGGQLCDEVAKYFSQPERAALPDWPAPKGYVVLRPSDDKSWPFKKIQVRKVTWPDFNPVA